MNFNFVNTFKYEFKYYGYLKKKTFGFLALGQAVNLASCLSKFPQAALNHDRNALYSATFNKTTFDAACNNEIMTISKDVLIEMSKGVEKFNNGW